jgi:2-oxoglutarate ferredoxin oxidoreductase subunit beta
MDNGKQNKGLVPGCNFTYCPGSGCSHEVATRLLGEVIEEMEIKDRTILVGPVGCSEMIIDFIDVDCVRASHGRAPSVATAIKRCRPDRIVLTYQGDGDLAAIGIADILSTGLLGEPISVIWVNNGNYGMTGGQMGPTTLVGQRTKSSPAGRDAKAAGRPFHVSELFATLPGVAYVERVATNSKAQIAETKKAIRHAIEVQIASKGLSMVEILGICSTGWGMKPKDAFNWFEKHFAVEFPLMKFLDR